MEVIRMRVTSPWFPLLLLVAAGCGGGSSSPTAPGPTGTTFTGSRSVARVVVGADTCLGRALAAKAPDRATLALPEPGGALFASLDLGDGGESCVVAFERNGDALSWTDYQCNQSCWWESYECDGRLWSFCRGSSPRPSFVGTIGDDAVAGEERLRFHATDGSDGYDVEVALTFALSRVRG